MKTVLSITEARKRLPAIIKSLKNSPDNVYHITVHDEVVAEIKSPSVVKPGEAAAKLVELRKKLRVKRKRLSFCDAVSFVVITHLLDSMPCFTFDKDFKSLGLTVYP